MIQTYVRKTRQLKKENPFLLFYYKLFNNMESFKTSVLTQYPIEIEDYNTNREFYNGRIIFRTTKNDIDMLKYKYGLLYTSSLNRYLIYNVITHKRFKDIKFTETDNMYFYTISRSLLIDIIVLYLKSVIPEHERTLMGEEKLRKLLDKSLVLTYSKDYNKEKYSYKIIINVSFMINDKVFEMEEEFEDSELYNDGIFIKEFINKGLDSFMGKLTYLFSEYYNELIKNKFEHDRIEMDTL